jgi:hypothetical protein
VQSRAIGNQDAGFRSTLRPQVTPKSIHGAARIWELRRVFVAMAIPIDEPAVEWFPFQHWPRNATVQRFFSKLLCRYTVTQLSD